MSYAQGFAQLRTHQKSMIGIYHLVKLLKSGVLAVSSVLDSYKKSQMLMTRMLTSKILLLDDYFVDITKKYQYSVREVVALAVQAGVPVPNVLICDRVL